MATTIRVALGERSYEIVIGRENLPSAGAFVSQRSQATQAIIITDDNVRALYAQPLAAALKSGGIHSQTLSVPAGEASKSIDHSKHLWNEFSRLRADRKTVVIALGGGVVGDLAGFVAATFARGLTFIQIPTTLLAQVDSSVGGKVGINLPSAKNIIGAFWQPAGVLIDLNVLTSLPDREYLSGLAEVVKYGVIFDADFFAYLEQHVAKILARELSVLEHIVAKSCQLKASVVEQDERELTGLRAVLNYGHTFCHAIETVTGYGRFLHGEAVSIGMVCASQLAESLGRFGPEVTQRQRDLLQALRLPTDAPDLPAEPLLAAMQHDKKVEHGRLRFVLPSELGKAEVVRDVPADLVLRVLGTQRS